MPYQTLSIFTNYNMSQKATEHVNIKRASCTKCHQIIAGGGQVMIYCLYQRKCTITSSTLYKLLRAHWGTQCWYITWTKEKVLYPQVHSMHQLSPKRSGVYCVDISLETEKRYCTFKYTPCTNCSRSAPGYTVLIYHLRQSNHGWRLSLRMRTPQARPNPPTNQAALG